ncbi:MAG: bifunctional diguanylate cyclase/phosphodiesterase [Geminicoccaceae bacterium]
MPAPPAPSLPASAPPGGVTERGIGGHLQRAARSGERLALLCVAFDNLDAIALAHGAMACDLLLAELGQSVAALVGQAGEVMVPGDGTLLVLQPLLGGTAAARALAGRVALLADGPQQLGGRDVHLRARVGVAVFPDDAGDPPALRRHARLAAMHAARDPRRRPQFFLAEMAAALSEEQRLAEALRAALADGQLRLAFQPQLDIRGGRIFATEALLRWTHPVLGPVSPASFVAVAERSGLIVPLGRWVLNEACRVGAAWHRGGADLRMAVNLSPAQVAFPELVDEVEEALRRSGLPAERLVLEVTERLLMRDLETATRALGRLRQRGVGVALDDFGAGHAGIGYLRDLPVDQLKIDRSLVDDLDDADRRPALTGAVVALGRALGMQVLAEGVETASQLDGLRRMGCDAAQGYLIARPVQAGSGRGILPPAAVTAAAPAPS